MFLVMPFGQRDGIA